MRTVRNFQVKKARTRNVENPGVACTAGVFHVPRPGFLYLNIPDIPQKRRPENEIKGGISSFSGDLIPS